MLVWVAFLAVPFASLCPWHYRWRHDEPRRNRTKKQYYRSGLFPWLHQAQGAGPQSSNSTPQVGVGGVKCIALLPIGSSGC